MPSVWRACTAGDSDHYQKSKFEDLRQGGDSAVLEMIRRFRLLQETLGIGVEPAPDPYGKWISEHQEELQKYKGERVAIHLERGVVAHGPDLETVYDEVERMGLLKEVVFDSV